MRYIEDTTVLRHVRDHITRAIRSEPTLEVGLGATYGIGWRHCERLAVVTEGPDGVCVHLNTTTGDTANVDVPTPDPQQAITVVLRHLTGQEAAVDVPSEYVTRDELADKLDEVYQAIRDAYAYGPEYGAAPNRPMPERPPIPPEPTGFGAIVRDVDGDHWARTREGRWLALIPGGGKRTWDDVAMHGPLTVVSEGAGS